MSNIVVDVDPPNVARASNLILLYLGEAGVNSGIVGHIPDNPLIGAFTDRMVYERGK